MIEDEVRQEVMDEMAARMRDMERRFAQRLQDQVSMTVEIWAT
jgi:hypothetical protein